MHCFYQTEKNLIKSTQNSGKITIFLFFFFKIYFFGTHKTFVLCSPGHRKHPAEDYIGACPPTDIMELFHKFKLWLLIQCRQDHIKHLCSSKKRQRKKRKERAVCQGEADKFVKGENSLSSL